MALSKITNNMVAASGIPSGGIIQVQYTQFTGTNSYSTTANTDVTLTDLEVNITPISTSSIIKIEAQVMGEWNNQNTATDSVWFFFRDSTKLAAPTAGNRKVGVAMGTGITFYSQDQASTPEHVSYAYFDSPSSTSEITYKVGMNNRDGETWFLNRTKTDSDATNMERGISLITVTEIAG